MVAGRVELRYFLVLYLLTLPFQLVTTGSFLEQVRYLFTSTLSTRLHPPLHPCYPRSQNPRSPVARARRRSRP